MKKLRLAVLLAVLVFALGASMASAQGNVDLEVPPITIGPQCVILPPTPTVYVCIAVNGQPGCPKVPGIRSHSVCAEIECSATTGDVIVSPGAPSACPAGSTPLLAQTVDLAASAACTVRTTLNNQPWITRSTAPSTDPQSIEVCVATEP